LEDFKVKNNKTTEHKMTYYDIIPFETSSLYDITEAIEEATRKIRLVAGDRCLIDQFGQTLPLGLVQLDEKTAKKINLPMAKLVKCER
jgi:hypothetical protein